MSTFLKLLPLELQDIQNYIEPRQEKVGGDHIVGVISDDLKKLWTLCQQYAESSAKAEAELRFGGAGEEFLGKVNELSEKAKALRDIFFIALCDEFELWDKKSTGVRKGFEVVWTEEDDSLPPFIRRITGM